MLMGNCRKLAINKHFLPNEHCSNTQSKLFVMLRIKNEYEVIAVISMK